MEEKKILCIVDTTGSMGSYLQSLSPILRQMCAIAKLIYLNVALGIYQYKDMCSTPATDFSGFQSDFEVLENYINKLVPTGGGDAPECLKLCLMEALHLLNIDKNTLCFIFTDAPPHTAANADRSPISNYPKELQLHNKNNWTHDWVQITELFKQRQIPVYNIINTIHPNVASYYIYLSTVLGTKTINLSLATSGNISKTTINLFLGIIGAEYSSDTNMKSVEYDIPLQQFPNENASPTFLPSYDVRTKMSTTPVNIVGKMGDAFKIDPHPLWKIDLNSLLTQFKDPVFKDNTFKTMSKIIQPDYVISLTYNTVLGFLWRLICKERKDPRRDALVNQMSSTLSSMEKSTVNFATVTLVRNWLQESYNKVEEINAIIADVPDKYPALILATTAEQLTREVLLELSWSCNSTTMSAVMALINNLTTLASCVTTSVRYIPLSLDNRTLFSLLSHLLAEGLEFSLRPSIIMAALTYLSDNVILKERAHAFMQEYKGKWFDKDIPENYSQGFLKLMMKVPEILTTEEYAIVRKVFKLFGLRLNAKTEIATQIQLKPKSLALYPDSKSLCNLCNMFRSNSLMLPTNRCGLCVTKYDECKHLQTLDHRHIKNRYNDYVEQNPTKSQLVQCKKCEGIYAIVSLKTLNVTPQCHYCRADQQPCVQECRRCLLKFVMPQTNNNGGSSGSQFLCSICTNSPNESIVMETLTIAQLYGDNTDIILQCVGFNIDDKLSLLSTNIKVFDLKDKVNEIEADQQLAILANYQMRYKGRIIFNTPEVINAIKQWVTSGTSEETTCYICCNDFKRANMMPSCGYCKQTSCENCLKHWYEDAKPGKILQPAHLCCPFCKQKPMSKILKRFNKDACTLVYRQNFNGNQGDTSWNGWCMHCYQIKVHSEKTCVREMPQLENFECTECADERILRETATDAAKEAALALRIKMCPNPDHASMVERISGCAHITCTCGIHWCFTCGKQFEAATIYEHIYKCNAGGGGYDGEYVGGYDSGYESDY